MTTLSSEKIKSKGKSRFGLKRVMLWIGLSLIGLILLIGIISQTGFFRNWLRDFIVDTANESLNAELSIGELDGNLFTNITLSDIAIVHGDDTALSVGKVHANYGILNVLSGTIQIDSVSVDSVHASLAQLEDSSWNINHLMLVDTALPDGDSEAEPFGYTVKLDNLVITAVSADIHDSNDMTPQHLTDFGLHLSANYETNRQHLQMHELHLSTEHPSLNITDFNFQVTADQDVIVLADMILATVSNRVTASGEFYPEQPSGNTAQIVASPISLNEFNMFLPEMAAAFDGDIMFEASLDDDILNTALTIVRSEEKLNLKTSASPISCLIDSASKDVLLYMADLNMHEIRLADWLKDPQFDILLNGQMNIEGSGIEPSEVEAGFSCDLSDSRAYENRANKLAINASLIKGDVACSLLVDGAFGSAQFTGQINDALDSIDYNFAIDLKQLDLSKMGLIDTLNSDVNIYLEAIGKGISPETAVGSFVLNIEPSKVMWLDILQGNTNVSFSGGEFEIDTLSLITSVAEIAASGTISQTDASLLNYIILLEDTSVIASILGENEIRLKGEITGKLAGNLLENSIDANLRFGEVRYNDMEIESALGNITANLGDSLIKADGQLSVVGLEAAEIKLDSIYVSGEMANDKASVETSVWHQLVQVKTGVVVVMDSLLTILIDELGIDYGDEHWSSGNDMAEIIIDSNQYSVQNLHLTSSGSKKQTIDIDGIVDFENDALLTVKVNNLQLEPLGKLVEQDIAGSFSTEIALTSPATKPNVTGRYELLDGRIQQFDIHGLTGDVSFADQVARFIVNLKATANDSLVASGTVPILLDSIMTGSAGDNLININIMADSFPIAILKAGGDMVEKADGFLDCDITVSQSFTNPAINGKLTIENGRVAAPEFGVDYSDIQVGLSFLPNRITIDSVSMKRDKGRLNVSGYLDYDSSLIAGKIKSSHIDIETNKFFVVRHKDYEVKVTSDITVDGTDTIATYGGSIVVDRSRFYLPALMAESGESIADEMAQPLLVEATKEKLTDIVGIDSILIEASIEDTPTADIMSRLFGRMKLTIPKNMWIKSPDLSLELAGDLEIVQEGDDPEIIGDIRVVRGHYDLFGRRIKMQHGSIIFQGGSYMDPTLDMEALYVFRTASKEKKELRLFVSGTGEAPVITFTLDDVEIAEGDAVSYIIFGRGLDELNQSQQSSLSDNLGAGQIAEGMASKILAGAIGSKLNMDVIEIKAGEDMESAAIIIGKYLTPDLFMSYQRSFGSSTDDDLEPEIVTLEYQLTRLIYLQLTEGDAEESGFDLILKFQKD